MPHVRHILIALLAAVLVASPAPGQQEGTGELQVELESFGAGNVCRGGEWVGVRLILSDNADHPRDLLVRVGLTDSDGDEPTPQRVVTSNPGVKQPVWLYFRLPFEFQPSDVLVFSVFEAVETTSAAGTAHTAGRLVGGARVQPQRVLMATESAMAVLSRGGLGLRDYGGAGQGDPTALPSGGERTEVRLGMSPAGMPDRWMGLAQYDAIVWAGPESAPSSLSPEQADAVREWVVRGGHLVVVLPRVGQQWTDRVANPLFDLLPAVRVVRREEVDLSPFKNLITTDGLVLLPDEETLHVFEPVEAPGATANAHAVVVMNTPDGAPLVVRRLEGLGAVTLVGLDVTARWFNDRALPDPELFWHRILGKRGELLTEAELNRAQQGQGMVRGYVGSSTITLDRDISDQIAKTGRAAAGLLIGFVVFVAYWLFAGPIGYFVLKKKGWVRHAWVGFVVAAGAFTAIAWGGATAIRPHSVDSTHLTILDHVYGQPHERARSWVSLLIPHYGEATVRVGDPAEGGGFRNAVMPWDAPGAGAGSFPDSRAYSIESRSPDTITVPTRATVKQLQVDWAGGPQWKMPAPVVAGDPLTDPGLRVVSRSVEGPVFAGSLTHNLPSALTDVVVVAVLGPRDHVRSLARGGLLAEVVAFKLTDAWEPGKPLDLSTIRYGKSLGADTLNAEGFFTTMIGGQSSIDVGPGMQKVDPRGAMGRLTALSFFDQLDPPSLTANSGESNRSLARRKAGHGLDLGRWFTQPCLIIVGSTAEDAPSPVPMHIVNGGGATPVQSRGRTIVRWVYPLRDRPAKYGQSEPAVAPAEEPGAGNG